MRSLIKILIIPILIGIIGTIFSYFLNQQKADVRYTLSEKIPMNISGSMLPEAIQQIIVKNVGNSKAEKIVVSIQKKIVSFELLKYSQGDTFQKFLNSNSFELIYPELPPQGSFVFIIKSKDNGIKNEDVIIKHNKGIAVEALSNQRSSITLLIDLIILFILVTISIFYFREVAISSWEYKARYSGYENYILILKKKTPLYISKEKWESIRKEALETLAKDIYISKYNIEESISYKLLESTKPSYLNEEEWSFLKEKFNTTVATTLMSAISEEVYSTDTILKLLRIKKPINFLDSKWVEFQKKAYEKFIIILSDKSVFLLSISNLLKAINVDKPNEIPAIYWDKYISILKDKYYQEILRELLASDEPNKFLDSQELQVISDDMRERLTRYSYKVEKIKYFSIFTTPDANRLLKSERPKWITDEDYKHIVKRAEEIIELEKQKELYMYKLEIIKNIISENSIPDTKSIFLDDKEWIIIQNIHRKLYSIDYNNKKNEELTIELSKKTSQLTSDLTNLNELREKIKSQLNIIHELLSDPNSIERIEDYENIFAAGNYKNLKRISEYIKKINNENNT